MYPGRLYAMDIKVLYPPGSDQCIQVDYMPWISRLYILRFRSMYPGRLYTRDIKVLYPPGSDQCIQVDYIPGISRFYILKVQINVSRKIICHGYQGSVSSRFRSRYPERLFTRDIKVLYPPGSDQCIQVDYTREQDQNFLL